MSGSSAAGSLAATLALAEVFDPAASAKQPRLAAVPGNWAGVL